MVYFNGDMIPEAEARVSIYDSALMFGDVAFEMTRSFNRHHFKLREHLERLQASVHWLHIPFDYTVKQLEDICRRVVAANEPVFAPDDEHRLLIDVTRGLLGIYASRVNGLSGGTNLIIADFPLRWTVAGSANLYREGIDIVIPSQRMIPASLLEPKAKNRNRIHYLMANIEASQNKGQNVWPLLVDPDGFLTEGTGSNFLLVKDGCLISPEPRNILRGISRAYIIELAAELGIPFKERNMEPFDIMTADEAFFCCTPFCIVPAFRFHGRPIGKGSQGPVYTKLIKRWGEKVGVDIIGQIETWAHLEGNHKPSGATTYQFEANQPTSRRERPMTER
jgi:branched-chain amino acid aminotransferase